MAIKTNILTQNKYKSCPGPGADCLSWPKGGPADCKAKQPAVCYKDLASSLTVPEPADFVKILSQRDMVEFLPCLEAPGWRVNFTIDMWPSSSLSRK